MFSVVSDMSLTELLGAAGVIVTILVAIAGVIRWVHRYRWKGVPSAREQEEYLRERLKSESYAEGRLSGTVTDVDVTEKSGFWYRLKKAVVADVTGSTEVTMRFDRARISENRLDHDPFTRVFGDPSEIGLVDAEHQWTKTNEEQAYSLVRIRISSMEYQEVGSWCAGLPKMIRNALEMDQSMNS